MKNHKILVILFAILLLELAIISVYVVKRSMQPEKMNQSAKINQPIKAVKRVDKSDLFGDGKHFSLAEEVNAILTSEHPDFDLAVVKARQLYKDVKGKPDNTPEGLLAEARVKLMLGSALLFNGRWNNKPDLLAEGFQVTKEVALNEAYAPQPRARALLSIVDTFMSGVDQQFARDVIFSGDKQFVDLLKAPGSNPVYAGMREMLVWSVKLFPYPQASLRAADFYVEELLFNPDLTQTEIQRFKEAYALHHRKGEEQFKTFNAQGVSYRMAYAYDLAARSEEKMVLYQGGPTPEQQDTIDAKFEKAIEYAQNDPTGYESRWIGTLARFNQAQWLVETAREDMTNGFFGYILDPKNKDMKDKFFNAYRPEFFVGHKKVFAQRGLIQLANLNEQFAKEFSDATGWTNITDTSKLPEMIMQSPE